MIFAEPLIMTEDDDTSWFALHVGIAIISLGSIGIILNTICLIYFSKLKTETDYSVYTRISFINLAVTDLFMSLCATCLRGPGYVNPSLIWGANVVSTGGHSDWCEAGMFLIWFIEDLNVLGVIPLSFIFLFLYVPFLSLTKISLFICIALCWALPVMEIVLLQILIAYGKLTVNYEDTIRRCTVTGELEAYIARENSSVFFGLPLLIHLMSWGLIIFYVCRRGNGFQDKQWWKFLKTGVIVILTFTLTWLPYFIVSWRDIRLTGWSSFVFCFFYTSVILNPVIYGFRSMRFNGKSCGDIIRSVVQRFRTRTMTLPLQRGGGGGGDEEVIVERNESRTYLDDGAVEDMNTIYNN